MYNEHTLQSNQTRHLASVLSFPQTSFQLFLYCKGIAFCLPFGQFLLAVQNLFYHESIQTISCMASSHVLILVRIQIIHSLKYIVICKSDQYAFFLFLLLALLYSYICQTISLTIPQLRSSSYTMYQSTNVCFELMIKARRLDPNSISIVECQSTKNTTSRTGLTISTKLNRNMRNNTFLYTRLSTSFVNGLCVMLDNKDSLLMFSFALQDVLRYILNGGTQLLPFQANYVEGNFQPSYRIRSLLLLSLICDVSSFSSYLRSYQHSTSTRRYAR